LEKTEKYGETQAGADFEQKVSDFLEKGGYMKDEEIENIAENFFKVFINRPEFAVQNKDGSYKRVEDQIICGSVIKKHIEGEITVGCYQLNKENKVKWVCFDFDENTPENFENAKKLCDKIKKEGYYPQLELSGGGEYKAHVWVFFNNVDAKQARYWAEEMAKGFNVHEIFPKQTEISTEKPFGNLVKLPLGMHQKTGKRSLFCDFWTYEPLTLEKSFEQLENIAATWAKPDPPKIIIKEIVKVVRERPREKKPVPDSILNLIKEGVEEGSRHINRYIIIKELFNAGYSDEEILEKVKEFNNNCKPPEQERIVEYHTNYLLKNADKYLSEEVEREWLEKTRYGETPALEEAEPLPIIYEKDLKNIETSAITWFIERLVPEKSIVMLSGKRGGYKSWGAIHIAIAIATGQKVFDKYSTKKCFVLYIDEENGLQELKRRVEMVKKGMGIEEDIENLAFISFEGLKLENPQTRLKLRNFLREHNPCIIIVDAFRRIISSEENDATAMNKVFTEFIRPIQEEFNTTWILIHHHRKGISGQRIDDILDELRGSSEITNVAESVIVFDKPPRLENRFVLRHAKARRTKPEDPQIIELQWDDENGTLKFEAVGTAEEIIDSVDLCCKAIMAWLEENDIFEFKTAEAQEAVKAGGYSKKTVSRSLGVLVQQGKIVRKKRGHYQRVVEEERLDSFAEGTKGQKGQDSNETKELKGKDKKDKVYNNVPSDPSFRDKGDNAIKSVPSVPKSQFSIENNKEEV
jgi:hypothetical protein